MSADLQDINTATYCLHELLCSLYEAVADMPCRTEDGEELPAAKRATAFAILARDEAKRIDTAIDDLIKETLRKKKEAAQ